MENISLNYYLIISAILFSLGICSIVRRNNVFSMLIGIELILNASILNFMAFWRFNPIFDTLSDKIAGPLIGIFIMIIATCELVASLAILVKVFSQYKTIRTDFLDTMRK